jgi:hypothetical protein
MIGYTNASWTLKVDMAAEGGGHTTIEARSEWADNQSALETLQHGSATKRNGPGLRTASAIDTRSLKLANFEMDEVAR